MKFVVVTYGAEGDTRPMALLSRALTDAGHEAHLLADGATLDMGQAECLRHRARRRHAVGIAPGSDARRARRQLRKDRGRFCAHRHCEFRSVAPRDNDGGPRLRRHYSRRAGGVCRPFRRRGVTDSGDRHGPDPHYANARVRLSLSSSGAVPRFLNRASHRLINALIWRAFKPSINAARAAVCSLPPRKRLWSEHPMLYGMSPKLVPPPADWPPDAKICGQWLQPVADWSPPKALADFLAAGEPPIYLGFGSMGDLGGPRLIAHAMEALRGRRALFYPGWGSIAATDLPANIHLLAEAPHGWLFPKTALVIHHGGAGTDTPQPAPAFHRWSSPSRATNSSGPIDCIRPAWLQRRSPPRG